jgi:hypothetical protein
MSEAKATGLATEYYVRVFGHGPGKGQHHDGKVKAAMADLVTVPNRELMKVGQWQVHQGGDFNVTPELITAAVTAHDAGVLRKPVIRLGHNDPRFTGDPAVGWVDNIHASEDGQTLYGDLIGVPKWLADNMGSAYPSVSIEGMYDYSAPDGTTHDFVLTGLALLGATAPGIGSLKSVQDVQKLYTDEAVAAAVGEIGGTPVKFTVEAADKPYGDVAYADPKNGKYPIDTEEHARAALSYFSMPKNQKGYIASEVDTIMGRIKAACKKFGITVSAASPAAEMKGATVASLPTEVARRLGIEPDADDDTLKKALDEKLPEAEPDKGKPAEPPAAPAPEPAAAPEPVAASAGPKIVEGVVQLDQAQYADLVAAAADGRAARTQQVHEDDERIVMAAIGDGRIPPARKQHWLDYLDRDREGGQQVLASLQPGLVPLVAAGHGVASEDTAIDAELNSISARITGVPVGKDA